MAFFASQLSKVCGPLLGNWQTSLQRRVTPPATCAAFVIVDTQYAVGCATDCRLISQIAAVRHRIAREIAQRGA